MKADEKERSKQAYKANKAFYEYMEAWASRVSMKMSKAKLPHVEVMPPHPRPEGFDFVKVKKVLERKLNALGFKHVKVSTGTTHPNSLWVDWTPSPK